jgi:hypothetical protein
MTLVLFVGSNGSRTTISWTWEYCQHIVNGAKSLDPITGAWVLEVEHIVALSDAIWNAV